MNRVVITGAANGIGKAISKKLYHIGTEIFACDNNSQALQQLQVELPGINIFNIDIADEEGVKVFFKSIVKSNCNWLVNNAGIYLGKNINDYQAEDLYRVFEVNCFGAIYCTRLFATNLLSKGIKGSIVNVSSVSGQAGSSDAIYGMTKAAVIGLTKSTATNFSPLIRVNAVAPGLVNTNMLNSISNERIEEYRSEELLAHHITPEQIASSVAFLLSDEAGNMTGATIDINNGCYLR